MFYEPLPHTRCTRVLQVLEATPQDDSKLTMKLTVLDMDGVVRTDSDTPGTLDSVSSGDFDALSYTWGSPFSTPGLASMYTPDHNVKVTILTASGAEETTIGRNLYDALSHIWTIRRRRYIWIDALCINQTDLDEKATHVQFMSDVYKKAANVLVWLGVDDPDRPTFDDVATMIDVGQKIHQHEISTGQLLALNAELDDDGKPEYLSVSELDIKVPSNVVESLFRFFTRRRYFSRAWIIQEIALSEDCTLLLGNHVITIDKLIHLIHRTERYILQLQLFHHQEPAQETSGRGVELQTIAVFALRHDSWNDVADTLVQGTKQHLRDYHGARDTLSEYLALLEFSLQSGHVRFCTNPHDAIYASYGYLPPLAGDQPHPVAVDYVRPVEETYKEVTIQLLKALPYQTVLSLVCDRQLYGSMVVPDYVSKLPSWVPDFNRCRVVDNIESTAITSANTGVLGVDEDQQIDWPSYCAGFDGSMYESVIMGCDLLVHARHCGIILSACKPEYKPNINRSHHDTLHPWYGVIIPPIKLCLSHGIDQSSSTGYTLLESLFRIICRPSPLLGYKKDRDFNEVVKSMIMWMLCETKIAQDTMTDGVISNSLTLAYTELIPLLRQLEGSPCLPDANELDLLDRFTGEYEDDDQEDADMEAVDKYMTKETDIGLQVQSTIFITDNNLVGRINNRVEAGDELWLICNSRTPSVVRRNTDGKYTLLGEALVDGAMYGELLKNGIAGEAQQITFC